MTLGHKTEFNTGTGQVALVSTQANLSVNTQLNSTQDNEISV